MSSPDPYRQRGRDVLPRSAITSTTRCRNGTDATDYLLSSSVAWATFTGLPSRSTGPPNTTVTVCPVPRPRLPPPPSSTGTNGTLNPALPLTSLVAVTVSSTVIDSTGKEWDLAWGHAVKE